MQEKLNNNDFLMYSAHNKGMSVISERFIKTLKTKFYETMTANDSKSYIPYLMKKEKISTIILINILLIKNTLMLIFLL